MEQQAEHYLDTIGHLLDADHLVCCDYEDPDIELDEVLEFMTEVEQSARRSPVLYSGHVLKEKPPLAELTRYRLWIAQYGPEAVLPEGWDKYWAWQYSESGTVPGINPPTDLNCFDGTPEQLKAQWSGASDVRPPRPDPDPERPRRTVEITVKAPPRISILVNGQEIA
jgi:GH25 family lysozyme M1 (1,4-beta-N-acetylmuramidase)